MKNSQNKDMEYNEIYKLIEQVKDIKLIGKNEIYYNNTNKTDLLYELGNNIYKLISACWLYHKYNKKDMSLYKIECVVSLYKPGIKDEMYNAWLKGYIDNGKNMRCFDKNLYADNIYILIAIIYINYGFCYIYNQMVPFIKDKYVNYFDRMPDKDLSDMEYDEGTIKRVKELAEILAIKDVGCSYEELCTSTSFNSFNNTVSDDFLTYLGIYVYELFAYEYIMGHYENIDIEEMKNIKAIILNVIEIDYNLPGNIYKYLNKNNDAIEKDSCSRVIMHSSIIFKPYYTVTAIKNIVAVLFHNYVFSESVNLLNLCNSMFEKFSNIELGSRNNIINYKMFLYYFCKINNFDYKEDVLNKNNRIGRRRNSYRLIVKSNYTNEKIEENGRSFGKIYKNVLNKLYKNVDINVPLLHDEIVAYLNSLSLNNKTKNKTLEKILDDKVNFNSGEHILYIMRKTSNCINRNHKVRAVTGILKNLRGREVKLNVNYCENCKRFSINHMDFDSYCKKYGIMLGNFSFKYMNFDKNQDKKYRLAKESILHFCGYNVNKQKDLTENERHLILMNIMDHGIMKKPEIMEYLHFYINNIGNRSNMELAVSKWEDDLYFVNNYKLDRQSRYKIDKIRHG